MEFKKYYIYSQSNLGGAHLVHHWVIFFCRQFLVMKIIATTIMKDNLNFSISLFLIVSFIFIFCFTFFSYSFFVFLS